MWWSLLCCYFANELNYLIILVQVRKGQSRTSWLDPCLPSRGTEQRNLCLTSPWLPLLNRLQTHLSAAVDWPSLRHTKSPTGGRGCWVSVISRPGKICCPVHLLFQGFGTLFSQRSTPVCLVNFTVFRQQTGCFLLCCVVPKTDKYIKPLDFAKCWLECLLALVATKQLLSVWSISGCPEPSFCHDRHSTR